MARPREQDGPPESLAGNWAAANVTGELGPCAPQGSPLWSGERGAGPACLPHRWASPQVEGRLSDARRGHAPCREGGREDSHRDGGGLPRKQPPGHTRVAVTSEAPRAQGGKGNRAWTGTKRQRRSRRGVTAGKVTVREMLGVGLGAQGGPQRDRLLGKVGISAKGKEELCGSEGRGPAGAGGRECC